MANILTGLGDLWSSGPMNATPNATLADFLEANQVTTVADVLAAGTLDTNDDTTPETIADQMLANWTFDGAVVPDRAELVAWITEGAAAMLRKFMADYGLSSTDFLSSY